MRIAQADRLRETQRSRELAREVIQARERMRAMHEVHGLRAPWRRQEEEDGGGMWGAQWHKLAGRRTLSSPRQVNIRFQQRAQQRRASPRDGNAWPAASFAAAAAQYAASSRVNRANATAVSDRPQGLEALPVPIISGEAPPLVYQLSPLRHQAASLPSSPRRSARGMRAMQSDMRGAHQSCQKSSGLASLSSGPEGSAGSAFSPVAHHTFTSRPSTVSSPVSPPKSPSRPATVSSCFRAARLPLAPVTPGIDCVH